MKINRKSVVVFLGTAIILIIAIIINIVLLMNKDTLLFHDNATFTDLHTHKITPFYINLESNIDFYFKCELDDGEVVVKIMDSDENIIWEKNERKYVESLRMSLFPGTYYYDLLVNHAKGSFEFKGVMTKE